MNRLKLVVALVAASSLAVGVDAKVALRDIRVVTQPDGTELRIRKTGDEYIHFTVKEDGSVLHEDENGFFTYAYVGEDGELFSTGVSATASPVGVRTQKLSDVNVARIAEIRDIPARVDQTVPSPITPSGRLRAPQSGYGLASSTYPTVGSPKGLIILVQYSDVSFTLKNPKDYYDDMINGANFTQYGGTGSALRYFEEQSGGLFIPSFDVLGPVTLPEKRSYYGGNDRYGDDMYPHRMVTHAIKQLDATVDFSKYDTDGDGLIDNVYVIYAGQGEASYGSAETVWPHSWDVRAGGEYLRVDGVTVGHYACSNEWEQSRPDGVGTFIHEFSHVMGLPDLYHTTESVYYTPSDYSVLDYGPYNNDGRTPPNYGAYERNAMKWNEPILLTDAATVTLDEISSGQFALIPTSKNTEFFLLENRQQSGWDKYIPGHGMLIWHIDYNNSVFENNTVNNTKSHQYVDIEEANNTPDGTNYSAMAGWPFPGTSKKTSFTSSTTPALKAWSGAAIDLPVTDITEQNGLVTFNVKGGRTVTLDAPAPFATLSQSGTYFTASWPEVDGATDYYITVVATEGGEAGSVETGFDNSTPGDGWTASATGYYTTANNYGASSPSFKFSSSGQTLTSPLLPGDASSLEFWSKGQSVNDSSTSLTVAGLINGSWTTVATYSPLNNKSENVKIELPTGVRRIRFTMNKASGNIALDDIVISYGASETVLPDYDNLPTGGATSVVVDKLLDGVYRYRFHVTATDGTVFSAPSASVYVETNDTAGVDFIAAGESDETPEYYNLQGIRIENPEKGSVVIERRGSVVRKAVIF